MHGGKGFRSSGLVVNGDLDERERQSRDGRRSVNLEGSGAHGREWVQFDLVASEALEGYKERGGQSSSVGPTVSQA